MPFETTIATAPLAGSAEDDRERSSHLLERVARGELDGALRIWAPVPALALTRLDELLPGAPRAVAAAAAAGLPTIRRLTGGHAALPGRGSLCVGIAEPATAFTGLEERYQRMCDGVIAALAEAGVAAERGDLEGDWCPGSSTIRSGRVKLVGIAQRVIKGAAWTDAVIELAPDPVTRELLPAVYEALGLPLDPSTLGSVSELRGETVSAAELAAALERALAPAPA